MATNDLIYQMLYDAKLRAKKLGIPFDLKRSDVTIPDRCPILGIELKRGIRGPCPNSPSIDRIVPKLGYIKSNIQIISNRANTMKSDATPEEIKMLYLYMSRDHEQI